MYTKEEAEYLEEQYDGTPECVSRLAEKLQKSPKSIIGKLSRMGIYRKKEYISKNGEKPVTKLELVAHIAARLRVNNLEGLDKAPKNVLKTVLNALGGPPDNVAE